MRSAAVTVAMVGVLAIAGCAAPGDESEPALDGEGGESGEGVTTGSLGGTYTATDGVITTSLGDNDVAVTVTALGQTLDGSELLGSFIDSDPINEAPFDCSSGTPVLQFETSTGRTPVVLTAAE